MSSGARRSAVEIQQIYLDRARDFLAGSNEGSRHDATVLELWDRGLRAVRTGEHSLVEKDLDWAIKKRLLDRYTSAHDLPLSDPRVLRLDLAYHDISAEHGLQSRLIRRGLVTRVVTEEQIGRASCRERGQVACVRERSRG